MKSNSSTAKTLDGQTPDGTTSNHGTVSGKTTVNGPGVAHVAAALALFVEAVPVLPEARQVKLLVPNKTFRQEGRERALRVSFDDIDLLKVLNMDPVTEDAVEKMPGWLASLSGKRVRIRGFMYPPSFAEGITQFPLARDNQICCFGRNPQVYDIIEVKLKDGSETNYIENRPFDVVGTFRIQAVDSGIGIGGLYYLDEAEVLER